MSTKFKSDTHIIESKEKSAANGQCFFVDISVRVVPLGFGQTESRFRSTVADLITP